jgi:RHS repeat-associated protein
VIRVYDYDPFGVEFDKDELDENPYRYCGEYYDSESGYTYLRARYYFAEIGRFVSEDPAFDGWNWYVYAGNNPVMFVDPTGLNIRLSSKNTDKQNQEILNNMQMLTNYKLFINDDNQIDYVVRKRNGRNVRVMSENKDMDLSAGNLLVRTMIRSTETTTIVAKDNLRNAHAAKNGSEILYNPNFNTRNNPSHIMLAHEMIHIDRIWRGQFLSGYAEHRYNYRKSLFGKEKYDRERSLKEELAVVGLGGFNYYINGKPQSFISMPGTPSYKMTGNVTENNIRAEQRIPLRGFYDGFSDGQNPLSRHRHSIAMPEKPPKRHKQR